MNIRSTPAGYSPKTQAGRTHETNANTANRPGVSPQAPVEDSHADRVELSVVARELNARLEQPRENSSLTPARVRELAGRVRNGYYDRPEVINRVLDRLISGELTTDSQG